MTLTLDPPRLETERMILRGFEPRDFDAVADFLTDETRAAASAPPPTGTRPGAGSR